jgi:anti-sigma regulatory factor (Ser/Thr protein kinase)
MGHVLIIGTGGAHIDALIKSPQLSMHAVVRCWGPLEAVRYARSRALDVLVTDPALTTEESLALLEEMKRVRPGVKVIVLAPALTNAEMISVLRAEAFTCFTPPFDHTEIAEMIRSAISTAHWRETIQIVSGVPNWLTLRVACGVLTADRLTRFLTEWRADLPSNERDLLMTAFREMLLNAMEHGAGFDPEKVIEVTAVRTARAIVFHFRDPGDGFDPTDLQHAAATADPTHVMAATEHRAGSGLRPGGFGMLIVRQVVDELVYNEKGNEVLMIKHTDS